MGDIMTRYTRARINWIKYYLSVHEWHNVLFNVKQLLKGK